MRPFTGGPLDRSYKLSVEETARWWRIFSDAPTPQVSLNTHQVVVADVKRTQQIALPGRGSAGFTFRTAVLRMNVFLERGACVALSRMLPGRKDVARLSQG